MKAVHYAIILGLICIASAFGVAGTYRMTRDRIAAKAAAESAAARKAVITAEAGSKIIFIVKDPDAPEVEQVFEARGVEDKDFFGYTGMGEAQGYGGKIRVMVGMDPKAETVSAVTIVSQSETPGLGTQVAEVKSNKTWGKLLTGKAGDVKIETTSEFLKQFKGQEPEKLVIGQGIDAISGATISSKGVTAAVNDAVSRITAAAKP